MTWRETTSQQLASLGWQRHEFVGEATERGMPARLVLEFDPRKSGAQWTLLCCTYCDAIHFDAPSDAAAAKRIALQELKKQYQRIDNDVAEALRQAVAI